MSAQHDIPAAATAAVAAAPQQLCWPLQAELVCRQTHCWPASVNMQSSIACNIVDGGSVQQMDMFMYISCWQERQARPVLSCLQTVAVLLSSST
jgi:hypothetical protein